MTAAERTAYQSGRTEEVAALEASLAVAWLNDHAPAAGAEGSSCETTECTTSTHCCGTATPKTGRYVTPTQENVCGDSSTLILKDALGREYDMVCSKAMKMLATAAAGITALYSLA